MSYWIFVYKEGNAFQQILDSKKWGFKKMPPPRRLPGTGDKVIFYLGGEERYYFAGEAKLSSAVGPAKRQGIGGPIDVTVDMDDIRVWRSGEQFKLSDLANRKKLAMIKDKNNWGLSFHGSIIPISEQDYNQIKELVGECR